MKRIHIGSALLGFNASLVLVDIAALLATGSLGFAVAATVSSVAAWLAWKSIRMESQA